MECVRAFSLFIVVVAVLALQVGQSQAAVVTFMSSTDFFTALGARPYVTEGYEGLPINSTISAGSTLNGITYADFPVGTDGRIDNLYNRFGDASLAIQRGGDNTSFFFASESFTVDFPSAVFAVGIFFNVAISPDNSLYIATPVGTATTGGASYDQSTLYFAGLISDTPFSTATFGGDGTPASGFNVDNLTYAAVPEPTSLVVLGALGLIAGLGHCRRRRA